MDREPQGDPNEPKADIEMVTKSIASLAINNGTSSTEQADPRSIEDLEKAIKDQKNYLSIAKIINETVTESREKYVAQKAQLQMAFERDYFLVPNYSLEIIKDNETCASYLQQREKILKELDRLETLIAQIDRQIGNFQLDITQSLLLVEQLSGLLKERRQISGSS